MTDHLDVEQSNQEPDMPCPVCGYALVGAKKDLCTHCGHVEQSYICDVCKRTCYVPPGWDAQTEAHAWLSPAEIATGGEVCDDCWQKMRDVMPGMDLRLRRAGL